MQLRAQSYAHLLRHKSHYNKWNSLPGQNCSLRLCLLAWSYIIKEEHLMVSIAHPWMKVNHGVHQWSPAPWPDPVSTAFLRQVTMLTILLGSKVPAATTVLRCQSSQLLPCSVTPSGWVPSILGRHGWLQWHLIVRAVTLLPGEMVSAGHGRLSAVEGISSLETPGVDYKEPRKRSNSQCST